jgi:hypothetical protein
LFTKRKTELKNGELVNIVTSNEKIASDCLLNEKLEDKEFQGSKRKRRPQKRPANMKNTNTKSSTGKTANLQYSDEITVEPTGNNIVNFKVTTRKGDQEAEQCEEVAAISIQFMGFK